MSGDDLKHCVVVKDISSGYVASQLDVRRSGLGALESCRIGLLRQPTRAAIQHRRSKHLNRRELVSVYSV